MFSGKQVLFFKMLSSSLVRQKSRMLTALLAIAIGAAVLMGMMTVYRDIPEQMGRELRSYGANMIFVPSEGNALLDTRSVSEALGRIPEERLIGAAPWRYESLTMNHLPLTVAGTDFSQVMKTRPYWKIAGRVPMDEDEILIGRDIAAMTSLKPGDVIDLAGKDRDKNRFRLKLTISGVVQTGGKEDGFLFVALPLLNELMSGEEEMQIMELSVAATEDVLVQYLERIGQDFHALVPRLVKRITHSETVVLEKLQALVYLVTGIMLSLTMICVATTMMAVVMERRKEIGLKKAVGAENGKIVAEFMGTGLVLGVAGGSFGCVVGYFFALAVSFSVFGRSVTVIPSVIVMTLALSVAVTMLACLLPVRRVVAIEPALVLRGE